MNIDIQKSPSGNRRIKDYKCRSIINDQEMRRMELLDNQKRKRENVLNEFRKITDIFVESDNENCSNNHEFSDNEFMDWSETKPCSSLKELLMLSEWMVKKPENLDNKWLFVLCPIGKRCLVKCSKGFTTVYGKKGNQLAKFQSALPNGSQKDFEKIYYSNSEVTILDCIWNSQLKCYFVLDLLSWKGQFYMDTETSFRVFWIKSKFQEMPWLSVKSDLNPYPFSPLNFYPCNVDMLSSVLSEHPYFSFNLPKIDGILFYHSEAYYTPGSTPLVVWLKPFMVPEILGIEISQSYYESKPSFYVDMNHYISAYEKKQKRYKKRKNSMEFNEE